MKKALKALVMSGGGAKFWFCAGALTLLKKQGHEFDYVYGTSAGALGALLWMQGDPSIAWDMANVLKPTDIYCESMTITKLRRLAQSKSMVDNSPMLATMQRLFPRHSLNFNFKSHAVATNLVAQRREVFELAEGDPDLYRYVVASGSIPILFPPVHFNDDLICVDGSAIDNSLLAPAIEAGCTDITLILLTEESVYPCNPDDVFDVIVSLADGTLSTSAEKDLKLCEARNHMPDYASIKVNLIRPKQKIPVELIKWTPEQAQAAFNMGYTDALNRELIIDHSKNGSAPEA